ncbi:MAG: phosphoglycerate kinase [Oscillospiraceae bacterium]|jgi:phosphoglycerate kinase|nr:phosphoglycerate kinase [Oscillospiraceae bacterium]
MVLNKKTVRDIDVSSKKVLVRCDFNVPLKDGKITNDKRISASLPTIDYLIKNNAKVILCSHLGRPKGQVNPEFSLRPVADRLGELLGKEVKMADDVIEGSAQSLSSSLKDGEVMLLENVRFHKEETENDQEFSKSLASLADIYVNDAFGTSHRAHSSTTGVASFLPAVCGFLIQKEIEFINNAVNDPKRPLVAILGGAKVSDKIGVITELLNKVDTLIVGGGMAYTFIKAMGYNVGTSLCEDDKLQLASELMEKAKAASVEFLLPVDIHIADAFDENAADAFVDFDKIPDDWNGLDIGPLSSQLFAKAISSAGTIVWNGPMGVFEWDKYSNGTVEIAKAVAASGAISIIGGGDSTAAVYKFDLADKMSHISTGGGASLELLEGMELPGIAALNDK